MAFFIEIADAGASPPVLGFKPEIALGSARHCHVGIENVTPLGNFTAFEMSSFDQHVKGIARPDVALKIDVPTEKSDQVDNDR